MNATVTPPTLDRVRPTLQSDGERRWWCEAEEAVEEIKAGRMVVVVGTVQRSRQAHLVMAAERVSADAVNFMVTHGGGLTYVALAASACDRLELEPMHSPGVAGLSDLTVTIEARTGVTTGISAADRARTIQVAADPCSDGDDLLTPGHVMVLRARPGGLLTFFGRTEAAVDLIGLAGLQPAAAMSEILGPDGETMGAADLVRYCRRHGLKMIRTADLLAYRMREEEDLRRTGRLEMPTRHGTFPAQIFKERLSGIKHLVIAPRRFPVGAAELYVHRQCMAGQVLGSRLCNCRDLLEHDLERVAAGEGALLLLGDRDRGISSLTPPGLDEVARRDADDSELRPPAPEHLPADLERVARDIARALGIDLDEVAVTDRGGRHE